MSVNKNKIAVFIFFMIFAFVLFGSSAFSFAQLPLYVVCNSSNSVLSENMLIETGEDLFNLLIGNKNQCPFIINAYPSTISNQLVGSRGFNNTPTYLGNGSIGSIEYDLDKFWTWIAQEYALNVSKIRFVFDPFVTLNYSIPNYVPEFWNFHQGCNGDYGCKKAELTCEARQEQGSVNSTTECVDYFISPKYASCRSDINGDFKCCGDDDFIDPGFEATVSEKNLFVWETSGETCQYPNFCSRVSDFSHSGVSSFKVIATTQDVSILKQNFSVPAAGSYYFSFWTKGINSPGGTVVVGSATVSLPNGSYEWMNQVIGPITLTNQAYSLQFNIRKYSGTGENGFVWIDDVHILSANKSRADYGKVFTSTAGSETGYPNLCYYSDYWKWMDPLRDQFKILGVDSFDVISNSVKWSACNAGGIAQQVYSGDNLTSLTPNYGILEYTPPFTKPTIITPGELEEGGDIYGTGENTLIIPEVDFEPGIAILNLQPSGAPEHCFNDDIDEGETDLNCGDGCRKCFIGEMCNSSSDCINGNCADISGVKKCVLEVPNLNETGFFAQRFICAQMDTFSAYTECCGYSLGLCANKDMRSQIRRAGNPLYDIFEFLPYNPDQSKNYALLMGLPLSLPSNYRYYNYPLRISLADNPLYLWNSLNVQYDYLEFYIASALQDISYLRLLVLKDVSESQFDPTTIDEYLNSNKVVFSENIMPYVTGQVQAGKWMRVRIPLSEFSVNINEQVKFISIFANISQVSSANHITHAAFNNPSLYFRNVISVDRIHLVPRDAEGIKYCGKYPPASESGINGQWFGDMDEKNALDVSNQPIGQGICENTPGFGWTGTDCCGNDLQDTNNQLKLNPNFVAESYADSIHGCVKGFTLRNDSIMNVSFNVSAQIINSSIMFYNSRFYTCNNNNAVPRISQELYYSANKDSLSVVNNILDINTSGQYAACYNQGSWYCDFDANWKNKSAIAGKVINSSVNLSNLNETNPPTACCPEGWCFYGNTSAPSSCVPSQSEVFQYQAASGIPYFFNRSIFYAGIRGNNRNYRCINGVWKLAELKWNPTNTDQGYCPESSQCYLDSSGCVDSKYFAGDDYCEEGNWSSRTKLVARQLLKIANETVDDLGWSIKRESLYCDRFDEVLTQVDYIEETISPNTAREIITANNNCPGTNGLPCANNFCALTIVNDDDTEKVFIGTSLNIPVDTTNIQYSALNLFREAVYTAGANHNDFCDLAIQESNSSGNYVGCAYGSKVVSPGTANIWLNHKTQTLIYSKEKFDINNTVTSSDVFNSFLRNPLNAIFSWARTLFFGTTTTMMGNSDFLANISDFRKLYISFTEPSAENAKIIRGVVEATPTGTSMMTVGYKNIEQNICYGSKIHSAMSFGNVVVQSSCNVIVGDDSFYQNIYSQDVSYWKDLTTNTRLEGTYDGAEQSSNTVSITSSGSITILDFPRTYTITVGGNLSNVLATSVDFGDGVSFSIEGAPENGVWVIEHRFASTGTKNITAGVLDKEYKTKTDDDIAFVIADLQKEHYINENTADEQSTFVLDLEVFSDYALELVSNPSWFSCDGVSDYILECVPDENKNNLTDGIAYIILNVTGVPGGHILNFSVEVTPVNTPPEFNLTKISQLSLVSNEDNIPSNSWEVNLTQYAYDEETDSSNLDFSVEGVTSTDTNHLVAFGCNIDENKILKCNQSEQNFAGSFDIEITASDSGEGVSPAKSDSQIFTIVINQVNDPPVLHFNNIYEFSVQAYSDISFPFTDLVSDIETNLSRSISCSPIEPESMSIANISSTPSSLVINAYGLNGTANYSCIAYDNDMVNLPNNQSSEEVNISVIVTLTPGIPVLILDPVSSVVNEGESVTLWIKATGTPTEVMSEAVSYNYAVLNPPGETIDANITDFGYMSNLRNLSFNFNTSDKVLPLNNNPSPNPADNNVNYEIQFNVTDRNEMSGYNTANIMLNRMPAISLGVGIETDYGFRTVYNGSYIFNYSASDSDNLSDCRIDWGDNSVQDIYCSEAYYFSFFSDVDWQHIYLTKKMYNITFYATDIYGAKVNATYFDLVIDDTDNPIAIIRNINSTSGSVRVNYTSSDDKAVAYCGYIIDGNLSAVLDFLFLNISVDASGNILWNRLSNCNSTIDIPYPYSGRHNFTFFAADTMARVAYQTQEFTVDTVIPEIVSTYPVSGDSIEIASEGEDLYFAVNASDNIGLKNITVAVRNGTDSISDQIKIFPSPYPLAYYYVLTPIRVYESQIYSADIFVTDTAGNSVSRRVSFNTT